MASANNTVESSRDIVQDLLVPELKTLKVSADAIHSDISYLRAEVKSPAKSLRTEIKLRDEIQAHAVRNLAEKLDFAIEFRARLASLEARSPRQ